MTVLIDVAMKKFMHGEKTSINHGILTATKTLEASFLVAKGFRKS
jgi:hypothetical protein